MLSFCGFMILMLIGFMFVKEDNKKKMIKIIKDNATLIGAGLVLLFLINGISGLPIGGGGIPQFAMIEGIDEEDEPVLRGGGSTCGGSP